MGITFLDFIFFTNEPINNTLYEKCFINHRLICRNSPNSPSCEVPFLSVNVPEWPLSGEKTTLSGGMCALYGLMGGVHVFLKNNSWKDDIPTHSQLYSVVPVRFLVCFVS